MATAAISPLWNGLARSLNTIAVRVGDLVGASNIFNFVYNTLQLNTLDPTNDVGLAQMVMGSQTKGRYAHGAGRSLPDLL